MPIFRGFIAVDINSNKNILNLLSDIKKIDANIKLAEPENIHITLKFLGETNELLIKDIEKTIKESTCDINPFEINIRGIGVFPNKNYIKVIWAGIENYQNLEEISKRIDEKLSNLGFKKEKREFSAHLTVGRVKTVKDKKQLLELIEKYNEFEFGKFLVNFIELKQSRLTPKGPIYSTISKLKLGK